MNIDTASAVNYTYTNKDDNLALITGSGYFSKTIEDPTNIASVVKINDLIYVEGSDGSQQLKVTAIDPVITVTTGIPPVSFISGGLFVTVGGSQIETFGVPETKVGDIVLALINIKGTSGPVGALFVEQGTVISDGNVQLVLNVSTGNDTLINIMVFRTD